MSELTPVNLQAIARELKSLALILHCCNQDLADKPRSFVMQRVLEQVQRIRALSPIPLALADCDVLARTDLAEVIAWLDAMEPQIREIQPPFRVAELGVVYAWASKFDAHADRAARMTSVASPFTELARQELQQKYGATEYLRRRYAQEPDDDVARINSGMNEALHRFPELKDWTPDDWSWLFFCSSDIVTKTPAWQAIQSLRIQIVPTALTIVESRSKESMPLITDPTLRADPLWLALDRTLRAIQEDRRILFTKDPASEQGCNMDSINTLAKEARLARWPVFEVRELMQGNVATDRWLKVHHCDVDEPVELVIWRLHGTAEASDAKICRLETYLEAWRDKRASQLKSADSVRHESPSKRRFRVALSFPGERREFVSRVADCLEDHLSRDAILYDHFYEAEFARPNLDTYLQALYHDDSDLICVFLCRDYEKKEWCGLEWRAIRDIIKGRREQDIMPFRFDMTEIPGLFSIDGYVWIGNRAPEDVAETILERLRRNDSHVAPTSEDTPQSVLAKMPSIGEVEEKVAEYRESRIQAVKQGQTPLQLKNTPKLVCHMIPESALGKEVKLTLPRLQGQLTNFPLLVPAGGQSPKASLNGLLITETANHSPAEFGYTEVRKNGIIEAVASDATTRNRMDPQSQPYFSHKLLKETIRSVRSYLKAYAELGIASPVYCCLSLIGVKGMLLHWPGLGRTAHPVEVDDILLEPITCNELLLDDCTELLKPAFDTIWNAGGLDYCPLFNKPN